MLLSHRNGSRVPAVLASSVTSPRCFLACPTPPFISFPTPSTLSKLTTVFLFYRVSPSPRARSSTSSWSLVAQVSPSASPARFISAPTLSAGQQDIMEDSVVINFLTQQAVAARCDVAFPRPYSCNNLFGYVTSVCTGSLVLGAAGLLKGTYS